MTGPQWETVKHLFHEALDRPVDGRSAWLAQQCREDPEVGAEVERLIAAHLAAGSFIETPVADLHAEQPPPRGARVGTRLGAYRLDALLGAGGMGEVYQAVHADLGRDVAIKVVWRDEAAAHDRLRREARNASRLNHPNICTIHHVGDHDGSPFIVMELVDGRLLSELIPPDGLPVATAVMYGIQILDALVHAHAHRVIHRDLKSANVMVRPNGQLTLLDFGLARQLDVVAAGAPASWATAVDLTAAGGTLPYMAPEILRGEAADTRTDLWAFGVLFYEMVTGRLPFSGRTGYEVGSAILNDVPAALPDSVPPAIASCILRCLEKERELRPQHATDVRSELASFAAGRTANARTLGERKPREGARQRAAGWSSWPVRRIAVAALASLALLTIMGFVMMAVAGFPAWRSRSTAPLTDRDTILVADFVNRTGDSDFDGSLRQGLLAHLQQSPFLAAVSDESIADTLKILKQPADTPVVGAIGRETCRRTGAKATVEGTIARVGGAYVLTLEAANCQTGDILAMTHDQADGKERVLATLGSVTVGFRTALGDAAATVQRRGVPLEQRTTSSLAALKAFTIAMAARSRGMKELDVRPLMQRAVDIDPTFAMAQTRLAGVFNNIGDGRAARDHAAKGYALRDRIGEYEQFFVTYGYHLLVTRDRAALKQTLEQALASFPRGADFLNGLSNFYAAAGEHERALHLIERCVALDPRSRRCVQTMILRYQALGEPEKLYGAVERAIRVIPGSFLAHRARVFAAAQSGDADRVSTFREAAARAISQEQMIVIDSSVALLRGQLRAYDKLTDRYLALLSQKGDSKSVADQAGVIEVLNVNLGRPVPKPLASASMASLWDWDLWQLAWAYALGGNAVMASELADEQDRRHKRGQEPPDPFNAGVARAAAFFVGGHFRESLALLDLAAETAGYQPAIFAFRGRVRQARGDLSGAREDYEVALRRRHVNPYPLSASITLPQTQIIAADLAHQLGDDVEARRLYEELLNQWKDADADFPLLVQVKDRLDKLGK